MSELNSIGDRSKIAGPLVVGLLLAGAGWLVFALLAARYPEGPTEYESSWIELLRSDSDPARMVGPPILEESVRDFSALGGYAVLITVTVVFSTYSGLQYGRPAVRFFLITVLGGFGCSMLLKLVFGRDRPAVVEHLSHVATTSFPSGHSMMSAIVWLSIGILLSQRIPNPRMRPLLLLIPFLLTTLVGFSRVALGVHYPTDVLAGWTAGLLWTLLAFQLQPVIMGSRSSVE